MVFIRCRSVVTNRGMAASLVFCLFLANVACSLAVHIHTVDNIDFDELLSKFINDINVLIEDNNIDTFTHLQESRYECKNLYSYTCDRKKPDINIFNNHEFKQKTSEFFSIFKQKIIDLLSNREGGDSGTLSVNLEQQLYQSCMNLGADNDENNEENTIEDYEINSNDPINVVFTEILKRFGHENILPKTWQQLDQKLAEIGFGHAFYDITVIADPYIRNKNIILLQPPSIKKWNSIKFIDTLSDIYVYFQSQIYEGCKTKYDSEESNVNDSDDSDMEYEDSDSKSSTNLNSDEGPVFLESGETEETVSASKSEEVDSLCEPFIHLSETDVSEKIINEDEETILVFFNRLLKAMFDSISAINKGPFYTKLRIQEWNQYFNNKSRKTTSKIDWLEVIKSEFKQVDVEINDTEYIFIKNVPYFLKLAQYLKYHKNEIYDKAVRSKFIAENARYIDWGVVQSLNPIDQSTFCFEQTQLYGVSQKALKSIINDLSNHHVEIIETIISNVAEVLYYNISENVQLSDEQKTYAKSQLLALTNHLLSNKYDRSYTDLIFDDYYVNFKASSEYLVDINMYRRMIQNNILKRLRDDIPLSYKNLPFDINEMENPRNRLILYTLSSIYIDSSKSAGYSNTTEQYYATFGVKLAGFLYSLVIENKFQTDMHDLHGSQWLTTHITYPPNLVKCFIPEDIVAYGYQLAYSTITEIFSVRIALEAMLIDSEHASIHDFYNAYIESHCGTKDQKMIEKVLSNLDNISTAFDCSNHSVEPKCNMTIFQK